MLANGLKSQVGNLLLLALGGLFVVGSIVGLDLGTARRMGPGFFPLLIGLLLCALALVAIVNTIRHPFSAANPDAIAVVSVVGGVAAFAFFTPLLGVLPAVFLSILTSSFSAAGISWKTRLGLALLVSAGVWAVFILGLQLPFTAIRGF